MELRQARASGTGARQWVRPLAVGIMTLCLGIGLAPAAVTGEDPLDQDRENLRLAAATPTEPDETRYAATDVLPWKLVDPKLSFEGYEHIITSASGGTANTTLAAKEYDFADYMFVIDGTGVGVYWEEATASRPTAGILNEVFALFQDICEGESTSGQIRRDSNDVFALGQGYVACQHMDWDSYIAVSVLNFGAVSQVFVTIGLAENREVLDLINSNISDVESKVFGIQ